MHENTRGRVTFLINVMFSRLDKFDEPIIRGGVYSGDRGGLYTRDVLTIFYGILDVEWAVSVNRSC